MKNEEIANLLFEIADYLEIKDEQFKPRAYRKAAMQIRSMPEDIEALWKEGRLQDIPGVGEGISKKIDEYLSSGRSKYLEGLKKEISVDAEELMEVQGLGPKKIKALYQNLGIKNVADLKKAAVAGKISQLEGFGTKSEQEILTAVESFHKPQRISLGYALALAEDVVEKLEQSKLFSKLSIAGSIRRGRDTIGDIDILGIAKSDLTKNTRKDTISAMNFFCSLPDAHKVIAKGETKSSIITTDGIEIDLRLVPAQSWGAALVYFTGSQAHNIELRKLAIEKELKLNEYGLYTVNNQKGNENSNKISKQDSMQITNQKSRNQSNNKNNKSVAVDGAVAGAVAGKTEEEIYRKLGMEFIPPEIRESTGEIDAAQQKKIPELVGLSDIRADLQMHSTWSDGSAKIMQMAQAAAHLGHEYIAITDHVGTIAVANPLDEKRLKEQRKEIDAVNKSLDITVLQGMEANILADGRLDMPKSSLQAVDVVLVSIHSAFRQDEKTMTERLCRAFSNEDVRIWAHPTARLIGKREPIKFDKDKVFKAAADNGVAVELNCNPPRIDLTGEDARHALLKGCKLSLGTDAHSMDELVHIRLGTLQARRAWATANDIINTMPLKKVAKMWNFNNY